MLMCHEKVSVIIPCYNAYQYIERCLDSVKEQTYNNIEIIIIDDGSTDGSKELIASYAKCHENIISFFQSNMNASIARNKGMELATGTYYLFLDADDMLYKTSIEKMVSIMESDNSDLVIGNYDMINIYDELVSTCHMNMNDTVCNVALELVGKAPCPTTKLYKADLIKNNNLVWGNVRIGQDLNFYLKYLLLCARVSLITDVVYGWRQVDDGMSNAISLRILDIIEAFKDVKMFYNSKGQMDKYNQYIPIIEFQHYYAQMGKQVKFPNYKLRRVIVDYFEYYISRLNVTTCYNYSNFKKEYKKYKVKMLCKFIYLSKWYKWITKSIWKRDN